MEQKKRFKSIMKKLLKKITDKFTEWCSVPGETLKDQQ